jgi:hypothetical protein
MNNATRWLAQPIRSPFVCETHSPARPIALANRAQGVWPQPRQNASVAPPMPFASYRQP